MKPKIDALILVLIASTFSAAFAEPVNVKTSVHAGSVDGGEAAYGCLGCVINLRGTITKIFPESDLNNFDIKNNDRIVGINSHKFHPFKFQKECLGFPGTSIPLDVKHDGTIENILVKRVDSRLLSSRAQHYERLSKKSITW